MQIRVKSLCLQKIRHNQNNTLGLEDFMNIKETPVTNAANKAFFMVKLFQAIIDNLNCFRKSLINGEGIDLIHVRFINNEWYHR